MEKVIIIAYCYPPCTLTASARPYAWARYLHKFGYYPIVITRQWESQISQLSDLSKPCGTKVEIEEDAQRKIVRVPYYANLRDRIYVKYGDSGHRLLRKTLSFMELVFQNFFLRPVPFRNMYEQAVIELQKDPSIKKVLITGNPFVQFFFGYKLKQQFPHIEWIADYRDHWGTSNPDDSMDTLHKFVQQLELRSERKWVSSATCITSVSETYAEKIGAFNNKKGYPLMNGYNEDDLAKVKPTEKSNEFVITYTGTLYPAQRVEVFLDGYKRLVDKYRSQITFRLNFPGLAFDRKQADRVAGYMKGYEDIVAITNRIPRSEVFDLQNNSHAFLMVSHDHLDGVYGSKTFEYLTFKKPIILCPDDKDVLNRLLHETKLGVICSTADEVEQQLGAMIEQLIQSGKITIEYDQAEIEKYSRERQTAVLADILNAI